MSGENWFIPHNLNFSWIVIVRTFFNLAKKLRIANSVLYYDELRFSVSFSHPQNCTTIISSFSNGNFPYSSAIWSKTTSHQILYLPKIESHYMFFKKKKKKRNILAARWGRQWKSKVFATLILERLWEYSMTDWPPLKFNQSYLKSTM